MDQFRPMGQKFRAITTLGKEWTEAAMTGRGSYNEIVYVLASVMNAPVITTPATGVLARKWVFAPDSTADDHPQTYTVEHGSSVRADKFSYGIITEMGMTFNRQSIEVTGSMLGHAITDNITLTPGVTAIPIVPIVPTQVSVYMDDTFGGLGTTKLLRAISAEFHLGSRYAGVWVLDAANASFINHIESEPDLTMTLTLQADAQGMALMTTMREGDTKFIRVEAIGDIIELALPYKFEIDIAAKVVDTGGFSDADGVYAVQFSFVGVADGGWGHAVQATVVNSMSTL